jgi:hypothetical protein
VIVKYDFKAAGLQEAGELAVGDMFINGGIMNTPNVFLVIDRPQTTWIPPQDRRLKDVATAPEEMYVKVFNITQNHMQRFGADKKVCKVKGVLTITGAKYCPLTLDCAPGVSGRIGEDNEDVERKADDE